MVYKNAPNREEEPVNIAARQEHPEIAAMLPVETRNAFLPFEIMSDGQCLVLTPVRDTKEEKKFQKSLESIHARFGRAMKRLAE